MKRAARAQRIVVQTAEDCRQIEALWRSSEKHWQAKGELMLAELAAGFAEGFVAAAQERLQAAERRGAIDYRPPLVNPPVASP